VKKQTAITILGFAVSIVLLYFSLKGIHFNQIWATLHKTNPVLALVPVFFVGCAVTIASFRWSRVAGSTVKFKETFAAMLIGMFVNNILPARLGEVARGYVLGRKKNLSFTYAITTVLLDRFFDLTGLLVLVFIFFPASGLPPRVSQALYVLIGFLAFCILLIIVLSRESLVKRLTARFGSIEKSFLSKLTKRVAEIQQNLKRIGSPLTIIFFIFLSACVWLSMSMALYCVIRALGVSVPFHYVPFVCALLNLGLIIPSSPGYIGVYQWLIVNLLAIFNVTEAEGFTISILYQASWFIPYTVVGFFFFLKEHLHMKDIRGLSPENKEG